MDEMSSTMREQDGNGLSNEDALQEDTAQRG